MSDLDSKLRKILDSQGRTHWQILRVDTSKQASELLKRDTDKNIAQIKQAFKEAGYVRVPDDVQDTWKAYEKMAGYMTGQEFYDRFIRELEKSVDVNRKTQDFTDAVLAAKKASGL